jgi:hypothetical protein
MLAPIFTWSPDYSSLASWLADQIHALSENEIINAIEEKEALLILDGLDELPKPDKVDPRKLFLTQLPSGVGLLVSSRWGGSAAVQNDRIFGGIAQLRRFDDQQLANYVVASPAPERSLKSDPDLKELARTPLFLAILKYCYSQTGADDVLLPSLGDATGESREKIFDLYVRRRLEHEQARLQLGEQFTETQIYATLGQIAFAQAPDDPITANLTNQDISKQLESALGPMIALVFIEYCVGLQIIVRDNRGIVRFSHLLLRRHFGRKTCLARWTQQVRSPGFTYTYDERTQDTLQTMKKLAWFGDERDVEFLLEAATHNELRPCVSAIMALGGIGHPSASTVLCRLLEDKRKFHIEAAVCDIACWALIQIGEGALPALRGAVGTKATTHVTALVLLILSRMRGESCRQLVEALTADQRPIDKSYKGSEGSELVGYYLKETTIGELAKRILMNWIEGGAPIYDAPFLREPGSEPWSPYRP